MSSNILFRKKQISITVINAGGILQQELWILDSSVLGQNMLH